MKVPPLYGSSKQYLTYFLKYILTKTLQFCSSGRRLSVSFWSRLYAFRILEILSEATDLLSLWWQMCRNHNLVSLQKSFDFGARWPSLTDSRALERLLASYWVSMVPTALNFAGHTIKSSHTWSWTANLISTLGQKSEFCHVSIFIDRFWTQNDLLRSKQAYQAFTK